MTKDVPLRVLFLTLYPDTMASSRLRVYQYLPYLHAAGIQTEVCPAIPEPLFSKLYYSSSALAFGLYYGMEILSNVGRVLRGRQYDLVFVQKAILSTNIRGFDRLLEWANPRFVFDLDDLVYGKPITEFTPALRALFQDSEQTQKISSRAARVVAGNHYLRERALEWNRNVTLIPTPVDTSRFRPRRDRTPKSSSIVIGWIGVWGTFKVHLMSIGEVLRKVAGRYPVRFKIVTRRGRDPVALNGLPLDFVPWSQEGEVSALEDFDIGIMPLPDNEWSRGKCGLKLLQYMAMGIPSVASRVGANCDIITEGRDGLLAATEEEWTEKLARLIEDESLRRSLGEAARRKVEENFSLEKMAPKLIEVLRQAGTYVSSRN